MFLLKSLELVKHSQIKEEQLEIIISKVALALPQIQSK